MNEELKNLKNSGWILSESGLKSIENSNAKKNLIKTLLDRDLREVGAGISDLHKGKFENIEHELVVLQILKLRNVSAPKSNENSKTAPKLMKLQLTDGQNTYSAIEMEPTALNLETKPGTKISLKVKQLKIANGQLLLTPKNMDILGGYVENLVSKWEISRSLAHQMKGNRTGTAAPPFIPFGQKIQQNIVADKSFKSLQTTKPKDAEENSEFNAQRQGAIAEATKAGTRKTFGGGNKTLVDSNVQKIVDKGYSEEQATTALKYVNNNVEKALNNLKRREERQQQRANSSEFNSRDNNNPKEKYDKRAGKASSAEPQQAKPSVGVSLFDFLENKIPETTAPAKQSSYGNHERFENNISSSFRRHDKENSNKSQQWSQYSSNEHKSSQNFNQKSSYNTRSDYRSEGGGGAREHGRDYKDHNREHKDYSRDYKDHNREYKEHGRDYKDQNKEHKDYNRDYKDHNREYKDYNSRKFDKDSRDGPRDSSKYHQQSSNYSSKPNHNNSVGSSSGSFTKPPPQIVSQKSSSAAPHTNSNITSNSYNSKYENNKYEKYEKGKFGQKSDYNNRTNAPAKDYNSSSSNYSKEYPPAGASFNAKYEKPQKSNNSSIVPHPQQSHSNDMYQKQVVVDSMEKMNLGKNNQHSHQHQHQSYKGHYESYDSKPNSYQSSNHESKQSYSKQHQSNYPIVGFQNKEANEQAKNALKTKNIPSNATSWQQQAPPQQPPQMHSMPPQPFVQHQVIHAMTQPVMNQTAAVFHAAYPAPIIMQSVQAPPQIQQVQSSAPVGIQHLKVGDLCLAKYWEDGKFYSAKITGISEATFVVHFTDYGNAEECLKKDCLPLTSSAAHFPTPPHSQPITNFVQPPQMGSYRVATHQQQQHGYHSQQSMPYKASVKNQRRN